MKRVYFDSSLFPQEYQWIDITSNLLYKHIVVYNHFEVVKGEQIGELVYVDHSNTEHDIRIPILAEESGVIDFTHLEPFIKGGYDRIIEKNLTQGELFYTIYGREEFIDSLENTYVIEEDEFSKEKSFRWTSINNQRENNSVFFNLYAQDIARYTAKLHLKFRIISNAPFLSIIYYPYVLNSIKVRAKDSVTFLYADKSVRSFTITRSDHKPLDAPERYKEFEIKLIKEDLEAMLSSELRKIKIEFRNGNPPFVFENKPNSHSSVELGGMMFKKYVADFCKGLDEFGYRWRSVEDNESSSTLSKSVAGQCYVYLMKDMANGFFKIGISNHPEYREHTLQSEKPTIELLCAKQFPTRLIAESIESALHKAYADKRLRGEWFQLDAKDICDIVLTLK